MATYKTNYIGGLRAESTHLQSGIIILTDAPTDNMGKGEAFSPTDLVATALGTCIITTMSIFGQKEGIDFTGSALTGTKIMTQEGPRKIARIEIEIELKTNIELEQPQKEKYERIAATCPVAQSLSPELEQVVKISWV
ncbi:MAG: OsmC family protein [Bacteroidota bacterium]